MTKWPYRDERGRVCTKCDNYKPWSEYNKYRHGANGHKPVCRECQADHARTYKRNPTHQRENYVRYRDKKKDEKNMSNAEELSQAVEELLMTGKARLTVDGEKLELTRTFWDDQGSPEARERIADIVRRARQLEEGDEA